MSEILRLFCIVLFLFFCFENYGATSSSINKGIIIGRVLEANSNSPIEYASIAVFNNSNDSLLSGGITNSKGQFRIKDLPLGKYRIQIDFIGYDQTEILDLQISQSALIKDVGEVYLRLSTEQIGEIQVKGDLPSVKYEIDKKVINVSKSSIAQNGTAVDVLETIPSVRVDVDGNVKLRGSSNFTVLINGKPTILESNDILQQLPATSIQNVEIITNPSAKYDAEGTAGIINIILKKNRFQGLSGLVNANIGNYNKTGGDALVNWRKGKVNLFFGINGVKSDYLNYTESNRFLESDEQQNYEYVPSIYSNGSNDRTLKRLRYKGGVEIDLNKNDFISIDFLVGDFSLDLLSNNHFTEFEFGQEDQYKSVAKSLREVQYYGGNVNYSHSFRNNKEHKIDANICHFDRSVSLINRIEKRDELENKVKDGRITFEDGPSSFSQLKLDYILPFSKNGKIESGVNYQKTDATDHTQMSEFNILTKQYLQNDLYTQQTSYLKSIYSIYSLMKNKIGKVGCQIGMRTEYTDRLVESVGKEQLVLKRWDYFPSVHFSYHASKKNQLVLSYARRIHRIKDSYLEPFVTWKDNYNVEQGNPNLVPEYINSLELGSVLRLNKTVRLSLEGYYRHTENYISQTTSIRGENENILIKKPENIGEDYSVGGDVSIAVSLTKWWKLNLNNDLYHYRVEGQVLGDQIKQENFNWGSKCSNSFSLWKSAKLLLNSYYSGPSVTIQGEREERYYINAAFKKSLWNRKLSMTLQANDLFNTNCYNSTTFGDGFETHSKVQVPGPRYAFSFSYRLNNYKAKRNSNATMNEDF